MQHIPTSIQFHANECTLNDAEYLQQIAADGGQYQTCDDNTDSKTKGRKELAELVNEGSPGKCVSYIKHSENSRL